MILSCLPDGNVRCLYTEAIDLQAIGALTSRRASHVEPVDGPGDLWTADLSPIGGPILGPFEGRHAALAAEVAHLETRVL